MLTQLCYSPGAGPIGCLAGTVEHRLGVCVLVGFSGGPQRNLTAIYLDSIGDLVQKLNALY